MNKKHIRVGTGPCFVEYARDESGNLKWVEIIYKGEAIFRANTHPREEDLRRAAKMVYLYNKKFKHESSVEEKLNDLETAYSSIFSLVQEQNSIIKQLIEKVK